MACCSQISGNMSVMVGCTRCLQTTCGAYRDFRPTKSTLPRPWFPAPGVCRPLKMAVAASSTQDAGMRPFPSRRPGRQSDEAISRPSCEKGHGSGPSGVHERAEARRMPDCPYFSAL
ncbi:hypothetical protein BDV96DRAFT_586963 [Lophiotrema nucula]|uniref:Uncharacterized protein n=1 Tax=Lophiotrema nucula TaxID=690887 RepID=A0A6A5YRC6_9PLEO|nr:hypothetical protein BDV96DRAFT_586963 [Lophiotrema nucula]